MTERWPIKEGSEKCLHGVEEENKKPGRGRQEPEQRILMTKTSMAGKKKKRKRRKFNVHIIEVLY